MLTSHPGTNLACTRCLSETWQHSGHMHVPLTWQLLTVSPKTTSRVLRSSLRLSPVLQVATQSSSHWSLQLDSVPSKYPRTRSSEPSHNLPQFQHQHFGVRESHALKRSHQCQRSWHVKSQRSSPFAHNFDQYSRRLLPFFTSTHFVRLTWNRLSVPQLLRHLRNTSNQFKKSISTFLDALKNSRSRRTTLILSNTFRSSPRVPIKL